MDSKRKSIRKTTSVIAFIAIVFMAVFMSMLIYQLNGYRKAMGFYTDSYYTIEKFSAEIMDFRVSVNNYTRYGGDYYYEEAANALDESKDIAKTLYDKRFQYEDNIRVRVEESYSHLARLSNTLEGMKGMDDKDGRLEIYNSSITDEIAQITDCVSSILNELLSEGNRQFGIYGNVATALEVIMIVCFVAFAAMVILFIIYLHRRIAKPIKDISEWTYLFKEGYCGMKDLQYKDNNEIGDLAKAFNIVKEKLSVANELKAEYDEATQKLKAEEEHKLKFVKQLYNEKRDKEAISTAAKHDGLTGLFNRRTFDGMIDEFIAKRPEGAEGTLFLIDMDNFKNVNDTLGHLAGDDALKLLAGSMRLVFTGGYLGRYGGDEFIAFMPVYRSDAEIARLGDMLCGKMCRTFEKNGKEVQLSVSVGIATSAGVKEYSELYMKADRALYYAKENGRNQYKLESTL